MCIQMSNCICMTERVWIVVGTPPFTRLSHQRRYATRQKGREKSLRDILMAGFSVPTIAQRVFIHVVSVDLHESVFTAEIRDEQQTQTFWTDRGNFMKFPIQLRMFLI